MTVEARSLDELNSLVTGWIMGANRAQVAAAIMWDHVALIELAIFDHPDTPAAEREIAKRGALAAGENAKRLRAEVGP